MTQEIPEPTAADEQAKADLDTKVAADEETVAGDLRTEEAAHAQSQADLAQLAQDEAGGSTTPTEAAPDATGTGTSDAASVPTNSQPSEPAAAETPDPTTATPDASAQGSDAPDASSAPDGAGAPDSAVTSPEPGATADSPIPGAEPVTEGQSPEGADPSVDDAGSSVASGDAQTAYVPPSDSTEPQPAATDQGTPASSAPFDPSSGGGVTDATATPDPSQGSHVGDSGQPLQDDGSWSAETTDDAGAGEPTA